MTKEDALKFTALAVGGVLAMFLLWHLGVIVYQVAGTALSILSTLVTWLLVVVMGVASTLAACIAVVLMGRVVLAALAAAVEQVRKMFAEFNKEAGEAAVDAAVIAVLAGIIGLIAYLSTGDFLKGRELSLIKGVAVSAIVLILIKIALYTNIGALRKALWPFLAICYLMPFALAAYQIQHGCASRSTLDCVMELDDDIEKAPGAEPATERTSSAAAPGSGIQAEPVVVQGTRAVGPSHSIASTPASAVRAVAPASAPTLESARTAGEPPRRESVAATADPARAWRQHLSLVVGHCMVFFLALLAMLFPFTLRGWRRLLGRPTPPA